MISLNFRRIRRIFLVKPRRASYFIAISLLATNFIVIPGQHVQAVSGACDYNFFEDQEPPIRLYDPCDTGCPKTGNDGLTGDSSEEKIWNYLAGKGLTNEQIAGVMSVLNHESKFNSGPVTGTTYGIAGWSGAAEDALNTSATNNNKTVSDLAFQLDYLYAELNAQKPTRPENAAYATLWAALAKAPKADDTVVLFYSEFDMGNLLDFDQPSTSDAHKAAAKAVGKDYTTSIEAIVGQLGGHAGSFGLNPDGSHGAQYFLTLYGGASNECAVSGTAVHPIKDGDGVAEGYGGPRTGVGATAGGVYCGGIKWHNGYDLYASLYTPVKAAMSGTVTSIDYAHPSLDTVSIKNSQGFTIRYMHMNKGHIIVNVGDTITTGQQIGESGNGNGTYGPHLHVEIDVTGNTNPQVAQLHANNCGIKSVNPNLFFKIFGVTLCPRASCDNKITEL